MPASDADKGALALEEGIVKRGDRSGLEQLEQLRGSSMVDVGCVQVLRFPGSSPAPPSSVINEKVGEGKRNRLPAEQDLAEI